MLSIFLQTAKWLEAITSLDNSYSLLQHAQSIRTSLPLFLVTYSYEAHF